MSVTPGAGEPRGTVTVFVAVVTVGLMMAVGLVHDGSRLLAARRAAHDRAAAAARAGAQAVDTDALRRRQTRIDPARAAAAARRHLRTSGLAGEVRVEGDTVRVDVQHRITTPLLALAGLRSVTVSGTGTARIVRGVTRGET